MKLIYQISAPGKAILFGEHAVVYGEDAIAFGIDLKCYSRIYISTFSQQQSHDQKAQCISFNINDKQKQYKFSLKLSTFRLIEQSISNLLNKQKLTEKFSDSINFEKFSQQLLPIEFQECKGNPYVISTIYKTVSYLYQGKYPNEKLTSTFSKGYLFQFQSQIPIGKGLGSSAAFNTVLAASLQKIFQNQQKTKKIEQTNEQQPIYKQKINNLSMQFEKVQHGNPSGIDNFVSVYGGLVIFNKTKNPKFRLITDKQSLQKLSSLQFGFVDSQVSKNTKKAVDNVRMRYQQHLKGQMKYKQYIQQIGTISKKCIDILSQDIKQDSWRNQLLNLIKLNHKLLCQFQLNNKQIDQIINLYSSIQIAGKITGSGMGGVVLLVSSSNGAINTQKIQESKYNVIPCSINCKGLTIMKFTQ